MLDFKKYIDSIPDFPTAGILFRDITPLLREHFPETLDGLGALLSTAEWSSIDAIVGIDARGFILAAGLATRFRKGFIPVRKQGKLPPPVVASKYTLEYGAGVLEMKRGTGRVLVVDDVLATGGTLSGAVELCELAGYQVAGIAVLIDIKLNAHSVIRGQTVRSLVQYGE